MVLLSPRVAQSRIRVRIAQKQILLAQYLNRNDQKKFVDIAPLAVWFSEGRAYVLAAGGTDRKIRSWRIDRFSDFRVDTKRKAPLLEDKDIEEKLKLSFKGYISDPVAVHLKVRHEAAYLFREFEYHPSQKITDLEDGRLDVRMRCATGWAFEEWVLGLALRN